MIYENVECKKIEGKIGEQIEYGNYSFVIYPSGKMGELTKQILNEKFKITELAMVDNLKSVGNTDNVCISFAELKKITKWYVVLFACKNRVLKKELISTLKTLKRPIVDVLKEEDIYGDLIFDFSDPALNIERINSEKLKKLFDRTAMQWKKLGETEPFWSVLTEGKFESHSLNEKSIADFYESGKKECFKLIQTLIRNGKIQSEQETNKLSLVEIGCGCGRITVAFSEHFKHVDAYDISSGNLKVAHNYVKKENVDFHLIKRVDEYDLIPPNDVVYTILVLQHNVPPIIKYIIDRMLLSLRRGGIGIFQVPSYKKGYSFSYDDTMREKSAMDMHVLPQFEIFRTIREADCEVLECYMDYHSGKHNGIISSTFVVRKN